MSSGVTESSRQSPPPESQSDQQTGSTGSGNISTDKGSTDKADQGGSGSTAEQDQSEDTKLGGLESNPEGPLEGAAKEKVSKD